MAGFGTRTIKMYVRDLSEGEIEFSSGTNALTRRMYDIDGVSASEQRLGIWSTTGDIDYYSYDDLEYLSVEYGSIELSEWPSYVLRVADSVSEYDILSLPESLQGSLGPAALAYAVLRKIPRVRIKVSLGTTASSSVKELNIQDRSPEILYTLRHAYSQAAGKGVNARLNDAFEKAYYSSPEAQPHIPLRRPRGHYRP